MKKTKIIEEDLELELELKMARDEMLNRNKNREDNIDENLGGSTSQKAVKSLMKDYEKDEIDIEDTVFQEDFMKKDFDDGFENEEQKFEDEDLNDSGVLSHNETLKEVDFNSDNDIEQSLFSSINNKKPDEGLFSKDPSDKAYLQVKTIFVVIIFSLMIFFLLLTSLLVIYIKFAENNNKANITDDKNPSNQSISIYTDDEVSLILDENRQLHIENDSLRNDLAKLLSQSNAEVITDVPVIEQNLGAESVVTVAPPPAIIEEPIKVEPAPVVKQPVVKEPQTYTVQQGDTLFRISTKFYGSIHEYKKIMEANNLETDKIKAGTKIIIP